MVPDTPPGSAKPGQIAAAYAVHVFTACGAGCALLALIAAVNSHWPIMFAWLGAALCIDGVDGIFARRLEVAKLLPRWSGDILDLVVDILNYVFVPAYALAASGLLPGPAAVALAILVHPVRISHLRGITSAALVVWALLAIVAIAENLNPPVWIGAALCLSAVYFVAVGFIRRHHP